MMLSKAQFEMYLAAHQTKDFKQPLKTRLLLGLMLIVALICHRAIANSPTHIHFAVEATYPPFESVAPNGEIKGFDIDLAKALCHTLGAHCTFSNQPWDSLIPGLQFKKFDAVISTMAITPERQRQIAFSNPYYIPSASFVVPKKKLVELSNAGLAGKTIGYQMGTTFGDYLKKHYHQQVNTKAYASESGAILDLLAHRIDALFGDTPVLQYWLAQGGHKAYQQLGPAIKDELYFGSGYGIALHADNRDLQQTLNTALAAIKKNGTYDRLVQQYFHTNTVSPQIEHAWLKYMPLLYSGLQQTLRLALTALGLGLSLGLVAALLEASQHTWLAHISTTIINIIRGLPEILVLFLVYYGSTFLLTTVLKLKLSLTPFVAGSLGLSLLFGSYASQVFRGALATIPKGQLEAAQALGLSSLQSFVAVLLPQTWRYALPGLANLWFVLLKDTALVSLIGVQDLMSQAQVASANTLQPFTFYGIVMLIYLILTACSEIILKYLSTRAQQHLKPIG